MRFTHFLNGLCTNLLTTLYLLIVCVCVWGGGGGCSNANF